MIVSGVADSTASWPSAAQPEYLLHCHIAWRCSVDWTTSAGVINDGSCCRDIHFDGNRPRWRVDVCSPLISLTLGVANISPESPYTAVCGYMHARFPSDCLWLRIRLKWIDNSAARQVKYLWTNHHKYDHGLENRVMGNTAVSCHAIVVGHARLPADCLQTSG